MPRWKEEGLEHLQITLALRAKRENAAMSEGVDSTPNPWRIQVREHPARRDSSEWRDAIGAAVEAAYPQAPFTSPHLKAARFTVEVVFPSPGVGEVTRIVPIRFSRPAKTPATRIARYDSAACDCGSR